MLTGVYPMASNVLSASDKDPSAEGVASSCRDTAGWVLWSSCSRPIVMVRGVLDWELQVVFAVRVPREERDKR